MKHFGGFGATTDGDFNYFYRLRSAVMRRHVERSGITWNEAAEYDRHRAYFKPEFLRMIYTQDGDRVGFISLRPENAHQVIELFCIEPEYRGIGHEVMNRVLAELDEKMQASLVEILRGNPIRNLAERFGFRIIRSDPHRDYYLRTPKSRT